MRFEDSPHLCERQRPLRYVVRGLVGGDDVEPSVVEWQAGRIRGQEEDVSSIGSSGPRQRDLLRVDVDAYPPYAERLGDQERRGAVAATDVQKRPAAVDRQAAEPPHRFIGDSAAVPDFVDETLFESCHSHGMPTVSS